MQWFSLILNENSTDKSLFCSYEEIRFICYLFDLGLVLKFQFSFVIYIYILLFSRHFYPK